PYVEVTDRLPREEALTYIQKSHAVLGIAYGAMKGIPSSKLYEYIGLRKPVLLCPTDNDIMERTLREVGLGYIAVDPETCVLELNKILNLYSESETVGIFPNSEKIKILKYSRFHQMVKMEKLFN